MLIESRVVFFYRFEPEGFLRIVSRESGVNIKSQVANSHYTTQTEGGQPVREHLICPRRKKKCLYLPFYFKISCYIKRQVIQQALLSFLKDPRLNLFK